MKDSEILSHFKKIASIPHCSFETSQLRDFLVEFARSKGASVEIDEAGNIHAVKGEPKICLQSHYDMVCVGEAPNLTLLEKDGFLSAKNSSLGADNGMGVAIMMQMLDEFENLECLFTNDEEVGLLGANNFCGKLCSKFLLNLDSEDESEVIIGCAGDAKIGVYEYSPAVYHESKECYEIEVKGLRGGHSGIQIDENIPNAIKVLAKILKLNNAKIVQISGGERINSIPTSAFALVQKDDENFIVEPKFKNFVSIKKSTEKASYHLAKTDKILSFLNAFSQGVRVYDKGLKMPYSSINLSLTRGDESGFGAEFFARAMDESGLDEIVFEMEQLARLCELEIKVSEKSPSWKPQTGEFANLVLNELQKYNPNAKISAVHAGLECGILLEKNPHMQACSIGPNIYSPHSINEKCELNSVEKIAKVVRNIILNL